MERKTKIILSVLLVFLILYGLFLTLEVKYDKLETQYEYSGIKIDNTEEYFSILQKYEGDCNLQRTSDNLVLMDCGEKEVLSNYKKYFLEFGDDTEYNKLNGFSLNIKGLVFNDYSLLGYLIEYICYQSSVASK